MRLVDPGGGWAVLDLPTSGTARLSAAALKQAHLTFAYAVVRRARYPAGQLRTVSPAYCGPQIDAR